jgi:hypothetical protein
VRARLPLAVGVIVPLVLVVVLLIEGLTGLATTPGATWAAR